MQPRCSFQVFIPEHTRDAAFQLFCDLRYVFPGAFKSSDQGWAAAGYCDELCTNQQLMHDLFDTLDASAYTTCISIAAAHWCRTNTPKDGAFLRRHATALKPRTYLGWLVCMHAPHKCRECLLRVCMLAWFMIFQSATLAMVTLCRVRPQAAASFMLCAAAYSAAATAIALGVAVALINVILVLSVLGGDFCLNHM